MTPERWQNVKRLFDEALQRSPGEREDFLARACGGDAGLRANVEELLAADAGAGTFFEEPLVDEKRPDPMVGRRFGPYLVLRRIGGGGMGSVYMGQRADDEFRRRVAIKAVRPELLDEHTLRRFHNERQTLAVLDHPHIIKLLDGGTTEDGIPYLVMDYAEGLAVDVYCQEQNLPVRDRLELFRTICAAVHYAHQNLVVHRDLKPDNILVTPAGEVKLLDFGIAKLLRPEYSGSGASVTSTRAQPMTPEYASPEQILGRPVTTASDIYALGVLLYKLLTGHHPYEGASTGIDLQKAICETEPVRPSLSVQQHTAGAMNVPEPKAASRLLRGDLDNIVLMAMRKEPHRRYASAEHMAEDIRRHSHGLPVLARPSTWRYRTGKFISRNRTMVAVSVVAALLLVSSAYTAYREYGQARQRFADLRQFANFAINDLDDAMREGLVPAREKLVAQAAQYLDKLAQESGSDRSLQQDLLRGYVKLGDVQGNLYGSNLGRQQEAADSYRKALRAAEELVGADPSAAGTRLDLARIHRKLGELSSTGGDRADALQRYKTSIGIAEQLLAEQPRLERARLEAMQVLTLLGYVQGEMGNPAGAVESFDRCQTLSQGLEKELSRRRARAFAQERMAYFRAVNGDPQHAERDVREALEFYLSDAGAKPTPRQQRNIAQAYQTLAEVQKRAGHAAEALESCRRSLALLEARLGSSPQDSQAQIDVEQNQVLLVELLLLNGRREEARETTVRALRSLASALESNDDSQYRWQNYAQLLLDTPFTELQDAQRALRSARRSVELTHETDPQALHLLARAYQAAGERTPALAAARKALTLLPPAGGTVSEIRRRVEERVAALAAQTP